MPIATVNGIRMYYRQHGHGPLLVLLHGWPQTGHCWRHLVGPLSQAYTVVVPDLRGYGRSSLPRPAEDIGGYVRAFERPGALRAGFDDYRAAFPADAEQDDADHGRKIAMPLLALWGEHSFLQSIDALEVWRDYAEDVTGTMIEDCGHFLAEERPAAVLERLRGFLGQDGS